MRLNFILYFLISVMAFSFPFISSAEVSKQEENIIQFKSYKEISKSMNALPSERNFSEAQFIDIDLKKMKTEISNIRNSICDVINSGSIELWIVTGLNGSIAIAEARVDSGLKITIQCK